MKKTFLTILVAFAACIAMNAAQLTPLQRKAKAEIFEALKKHSSDVSDDGDEVILFKYDNYNYRVSVGSLNAQTLYLCLGLFFHLTDEYDPDIANRAAFHAAGDKPVCSIAIDGMLAFSCEMYAKESKPFVAVLPDMLQALRSSAVSFEEEYRKATGTHASSSAQTTSTEKDDNVFAFPKFASNGDAGLHIEKVTLSSDCTVLDMISYNGGQYQWCSISRDSYISAGMKRYPLSRAEGIAYSPEETDYPDYESGRNVPLRFKLYFQPLPKGTTGFDFSEGTDDGWQIRGIELKHGISYVINGKKIETDAHIWNCTSIEIQNGQTILTKIVRPKNSFTYLYSSQEEYIEDADTGRKYYLTDSSIGFESSLKISTDTDEITFHETYPALPPDVKRINISNGSGSYYVESLKIR